jgi:hypothetical protein
MKSNGGFEQYEGICSLRHLETTRVLLPNGFHPSWIVITCMRMKNPVKNRVKGENKSRLNAKESISIKEGAHIISWRVVEVIVLS